MSLTSVLLVDVVQPLDLYFGVAKSTMMGPLTPFLPLWMCAATGASMFLSFVNVQHTWRVLVFTVTAALPAPPAGPAGLSDLALSGATRSTTEAEAVAGSATSATAARGRTTN